MNPPATAVRKPRLSPQRLQPNPLVKRRLPRLPPRLIPPAADTAGKKRMTSCSMDDPATFLTAAVVTVSDSCSRGDREDRSGPALAKVLQKLNFSVIANEVIPDNPIQIQNVLIRLSRQVRFVVTTGGTGNAPRDVTPEATVAVCEIG